jgi:hypothetical protein
MVEVGTASHVALEVTLYVLDKLWEWEVGERDECRECVALDGPVVLGHKQKVGLAISPMKGVEADP